MRSYLPDEQGKRIVSFLAHQRTGVISTTGSPGVWAMPVWYRPLAGTPGSRDLKVDCLIPRWADVSHHLVHDSRVVLIIQASSGAGLRWLQMQGTARPVEAPDWSRLLPRWVSVMQPHALYPVVRVTPGRTEHHAEWTPERRCGAGLYRPIPFSRDAGERDHAVGRVHQHDRRRAEESVDVPAVVSGGERRRVG